MNGRGIRLSVVALFFFACALSWSSLAGGQASRKSQSQSPRELLQQYVAELQNNPDDETLREKIIQLALTTHPAPAIPEEAHNHFIKGKAYLENAQQAQDVQSAVSAVDEFKKVLALAPWQPQYYYDLGLAYEKLGTLSHSVDDLDLAAADYKLYLVSNPQDAPNVQDKILALDVEKQIAARATAAEAQQLQQAVVQQEEVLAEQQDIQKGATQLAQEKKQEISQEQKQAWRAEEETEQAKLGELKDQAETADKENEDNIKSIAQSGKPPAIPEEARRHYAMGDATMMALKDANGITPSAFDEAIRQYQQAVQLAPWWANAYYNLGAALYGRERYADAISAWKLYLVAAPNAADAQTVQDHIDMAVQAQKQVNSQ